MTSTPASRAYRAKWNATRKAKRREMLVALKAERGCADCGIKHPAVLQFHHRDGAEKEKEVGRMVSHNCTETQLWAEIDKCDILCANCHIIRHYTEATGYFAQSMETEIG